MKLGSVLLLTSVLVATATLGDDGPAQRDMPPKSTSFTTSALDCPTPIAAGWDLWESARDGDIFPPDFEFGFSITAHAPGIPADFFGPGSDPFEGSINLTGDPLSGAFGLADAIIERPAPTVIPDPLSSPVTIDIELVALSLVGSAPITVTYNGGQNPESWEVKVCLGELAPSPGTMDISSDCCEGGTFHAELDVWPRFTFTRVQGTAVAILDFTWQEYPPVPWAYDGSWAVELSPPDIPGPVPVDHDCYVGTADIVVGPSPRFLVTGGTGDPWFGDPCAGDCPDPIAAGHDLWETARDGDIFPPDFEFGFGPDAHAPGIPADFFGPGSDPFDGIVELTGDPLAGAFGLADAIVERPAPTTIPDPLSPPQPIPIELVALSLVSVQPITVTYDGGQNPELWDVKVCLSEVASSPGTMDISSDCCEGGTFQAALDIMPKFTFTSVSGNLEIPLDWGWNYPAVPWTYDGHWLVELSPPDIPGPVPVDHDCQTGTPDIVVGPNPRLLVTGGTGVPWFGDPCSGCPDPIAAGHDLWESARDGDIFPPDFDFGTDTPPIPADFFGPGSDPFDGQINLTGDPLSDAFGLADAIIERPAPTAIPAPLSPPQPIAIELVALSLVSVQPITVTYNGGMDPESWDVKVCLSEVASSPGTMDISSDCCEGGTFHVELGFWPRFTFTRMQDAQEATLDFGWWDAGAVPSIYDGKWLVEVSPPDIPGPVQVDHDCYAATTDIVIGPSPRLLITGGTGVPWFGEPCSETCCVGRVGDANGQGGDEPTIGDVSVMIDAKFITGTCDGILNCFTEADINQSGLASPTCDDVTIGDISYLIDYLFITGPSLGLADCL